MSCDPASSGGGSFDGGTIAGPVLIATPDSGASGATEFSVTNGDSNQVALLRSSGIAEFHSEVDDRTFSIYQDVAQSNTDWMLYVRDSGGGTGGVGAGGYLKMESVNTAPADASLVAGQLALWFDKTNGASKLMVKAKQADGTVKTAAVALA